MKTANNKGRGRSKITKETIKKVIEENRELLRKFKIKSVALFGSYARGEQGKDSDVDILVEFDDGASLFDLIGFQDETSELLGKKVDAVSKRGLSKYIGPYILAEAETIAEG